MPPLHRLPPGAGEAAAAPPPEDDQAAARAAASAAAGTAAARRPPGEAAPTPLPPPGLAREAPETDPDAEVDPLAEVSALAAAAAEGRTDAPPRPAGGLAGQLLDFLSPRPRHPEALSPNRVLPLLELAAAELARAGPAGGEDEISRLGAVALAQEIERHREVAERRNTLLGPPAA